MKNIEIHPELLNIDRMKSKAPTKKDLKEISAFIRKEKENKLKAKESKFKSENESVIESLNNSVKKS
jgi:hypothetical protein